MSTARLRTVIVDDEEPARELLRALLRDWPIVDIVGEAADGVSALAVIGNTSADLVLLDVQMPGRNGIEVAADLARSSSPPLIVFITAYDQYAVRAFEISACDYLLKPFDAERLGTALERVLARHAQNPDGIVSALQRLLEMTAQRPVPDQTVTVKSEGRHFFLASREIEWIEAVGKDVRVHTGGPVLTVRETMSSLESRLDATYFVRVHRSAIVNRAHIREMQPWFKGDYVVVLKRGTRILTGRTYRPVVQELLAGATAVRDE